MQARSTLSTSEIAGSTTTFTHLPKDVQGTYRISGYLLSLKYDNGDEVTRAIVFDPNDDDTIWLDGYNYTP